MASAEPREFPTHDQIKATLRMLFLAVGVEKLTMLKVREHLKQVYNMDFTSHNNVLAVLVPQVMVEDPPVRRRRQRDERPIATEIPVAQITVRWGATSEELWAARASEMPK
jgi:vacuolar-type H+-ATPase subunit F/Vma7